MLHTHDDDNDTVMPLLLCRTRGGPLDDEAFLSGWRLGLIAATLAMPGVSALSDAIRPVERDQADLIAMAGGYLMRVDASDDAGVVGCHLHPGY